jgi:hypothetical protein
VIGFELSCHLGYEITFRSECLGSFSGDQNKKIKILSEKLRHFVSVIKLYSEIKPLHFWIIILLHISQDGNKISARKIFIDSIDFLTEFHHFRVCPFLPKKRFTSFRPIIWLINNWRSLLYCQTVSFNKNSPCDHPHSF